MHIYIYIYICVYIYIYPNNVKHAVTIYHCNMLMQ